MFVNTYVFREWQHMNLGEAGMLYYWYRMNSAINDNGNCIFGKFVWSI